MNRPSRIYFLAAGLVWLVACSDVSTNAGDEPSIDSTATSVAATTSVGTVTAESTTTTVADITNVIHPPASGEFVGALDDIKDQSCDQQDAGWRTTGTATNPTGEPVDYRIYISLLDGSSTTRALVETELLAVAAGTGATFDELIAIPDDDLRCVLRVERRAVGT